MIHRTVTNSFSKIKPSFIILWKFPSILSDTTTQGSDYEISISNLPTCMGEFNSWAQIKDCVICIYIYVCVPKTQNVQN